jgi:hypothetical protein
MDKYNIDYSLISNIEGVEFDNDQNLIPKEFQHSQKEINEVAIELISKLPNLYGDTTWVKPENSLKMIKKCGIDKLLFGTDSPIDRIYTYDNQFYQTYFNDFKNELSSEDYDKLIYKNAVKLFKLPINKIGINIEVIEKNRLKVSKST